MYCIMIYTNLVYIIYEIDFCGGFTGQELNRKEEEELMSWESFMKENYMASVKQDSSQSMEYRIEDTAEK